MGDPEFRESYVLTKIFCMESTGQSPYMIYNQLEQLYDCPENSRLSYDNETLKVGCTTTPIPCLADIVGRDLKTEHSSINWLGHTALVASSNEANPQIMEVLNDTTPGIFFDPLYGSNSFSSQAKYWGERYGAVGNERLLLNSAQEIIENGVDQTHYTFSYTAGWTYYSGGTSDHPSDCQFRCDSFVYYCYDTAGIKIESEFLPFIVPLKLFYDFQCSANPPEYCLIADYQVDTTMTEKGGKQFDVSLLESIPDSVRNTTTPTLDIFNVLRPVFATHKQQREQLPSLIKQYQTSSDSKAQELFARCVCFELKHKEPADIAPEVKPMLSDLLWEYKDRLDDNFPLAIMKNELKIFIDQPHCRWLNAYFTTLTETIADKEAGVIDFIDHEEDFVKKAHLVSASRLSSLSTLTADKKCEYGRFFQKAYNHDKSLSTEDRKLLRLGLVELNTHPTNEAAPVHSSCRPPGGA